MIVTQFYYKIHKCLIILIIHFCFSLDDETNEFTTITIGKKKEDNTENSKNTVISSLFKINYDLWKVNIFNFFNLNVNITYYKNEKFSFGCLKSLLF